MAPVLLRCLKQEMSNEQYEKQLTLFGLATSLGLGFQQINAGLGHMFGVTQNVTVQVLLIVVITSFATISVVLGLDKGIRRLSLLNMGLAFCLLTFSCVNFLSHVQIFFS